MKPSHRFLLLAATAAVLLPDLLHGQFISQTAERGSYLNYAGRNYENYSAGLLRRKFYDNFGNFLVDGVQIFTLDEQSQTAVSEYPAATSSLTKTRFYSSYFQNLVILNDSYSGLTSRLMIGDVIRTKFTSLTLDKARFNGIRWDVSTSKYRGTMLASRVSDPIRMDPENVLTSAQAITHIREWTAFLLGGHFEADLGDVLTVGATYVNQHQTRSSSGAEAAGLKGTVTNAIPRVIFVRIQDDTPGDYSGPQIFGVPQIYINGTAYSMTNINNRVPDPYRVDLRSPIQYWVFRDFEPVYFATYPDPDSTSYTQYAQYKTRFSSSLVSPLPTYPFTIPSQTEVKPGTNYPYNVTYAYVIPPGVDRVDFAAILANDYRIEAGHDWINNADEYNVPGFRSHADSNVAGTFPAVTTFRTMARAEGNIKDGSNRRVVRFSYGLASGLSVYSLNFKLNWNNFKLEGEFAQSVNYLKYPISRGFRFEDVGKAFFIRGTKTMGRFTLGGERYHIDPQFSTLFHYYTLDNYFYGTYNDPDRPDRTTFQRTVNGVLEPASQTSATATVGGYDPRLAGGAAYAAVDDNDDDDRWEDGYYFYNVRAYPNVRNGDVINFDYAGTQKTPGFTPKQLRLGYRQNVNELTGLGEIIRKPDAGIFPGKDKDRDGIPDDDRNSNGVPDYSEDFLTFYSDPPFFSYGDDWNNNAVIDEQENDILPDYPYNPDIDGLHAFANTELLRNMNLRFGSIREKSPAQGGRVRSDYARWSYASGTPLFGSVNLLYIFKRVMDNIPNNGYQFGSAITVTEPYPTFTFDSLEYKNSVVHQAYVGAVYTQVPGLRIENIVKYEYNEQFAIGTGLRDVENRYINPLEQSDGYINKLGIVNKIEYSMPLMNGRLRLNPQLKVRTQRTSRFGEFTPGKPANQVVRSEQQFIPIIRLDYALTERTDLRIGLQGFGSKTGPFAVQIRDLKMPSNDINQTTYAVALSNKSSYGGYNVVVDAGYKYTTASLPRYPDPRYRDRDISYIFMTVYAGF